MPCPECPHCRLSPLSGAAIALEVATSYRLDLRRLKSPLRDQHLALVRHLAMYLMREMTDLSFPAIGAMMNRDHSTVMSGYNRIARMMGERPRFAQEVAKLRERIVSKGAQTADQPSTIQGSNVRTRVGMERAA